MATIHFKSAVGKITFDGGFTEEGTLIRKTKTYRNIMETASADNLYQGLTELANLSAMPLLQVEKIETSGIHQ